jgi:hypothetical protein
MPMRLGSDIHCGLHSWHPSGPGPPALYAAGSLGLRRIAMLGDLLANGKVLQAFALSPVASAASNGGLTFGTMAELGGGESPIY